MKPKLIADVVPPFPPYEDPREIRVRVTGKVSKHEEARFFFVSVRNMRGKTAEDVRPFLFATGRTGMIPLSMISPMLEPWMYFAWTGTRAEFTQNEHPLASAIIYSENAKESVTLNPKGAGRAFILFFTIRNENRIFFPTKTRMTYGIPSTFDLTLMFETRDWGIYLSKTLRVDVQAWDSFHVSELKPKSRLQFLRKSPE